MIKFSTEEKSGVGSQEVGTSQFDPNTGLHTFSHYMNDLQELLRRNQALGLVFIDATELGKIEYDYGQGVYQGILKQVVDAIQSLKGHLVRSEDILTTRHLNDEYFLLFLSAARPEYSNFLKLENLQNIIDRFVHSLNAKVFQATFPYTRKILKVNVGYAYAVHNPLLAGDRTIYRLIDQAKQMAGFNGDKFLIQINETLKEVIVSENISTHFQPLVNLSDGSIFGYEALTRGPAGSPMESPLMLFGIADKANLSFELDRLCRKKALQNCKGLPKGQKIFVNTFPTTMHDPEFKGEPLHRLLRDIGLDPRDIVFEITERFAIENYNLFHKEYSYYADLGFGLAVDDIGTGYGSLEAIANLKPHFVKVDLSIIRDIHNSSVKRELLKAVCDIGRKVNAKILAEGIETQEELNVVRSMGVDLAQGYRLARPAPELFAANKVFNLEGK